MKKIILFLVLGFLFSCTTAVVSEKPVASPQVDHSGPRPSLGGKFLEQNIDFEGLKNFLKLERPYNQLGYSEKRFNTCEVGYGYSRSNDCRPKTFVVIHFQLMCRNSEGTISEALTQNDLRAISRQEVRWNLKNATGQVLTDSEGFGAIAIVSDESQKSQRLRLTVGNDFLFLKAGEITQMITPKSWCN